MRRNRLDRAKLTLRRKKAIKKAGDKAKTPDARDVVRKRARRGDPLWFPWWRR